MNVSLITLVIGFTFLLVCTGVLPVQNLEDTGNALQEQSPSSLFQYT